MSLHGHCLLSLLLKIPKIGVDFVLSLSKLPKIGVDFDSERDLVRVFVDRKYLAALISIGVIGSSSKLSDTEDRL